MSTPLDLLDKAPTQRPIDDKMAKGGVRFDSCSDECVQGVTESPGVKSEDERFEVGEL
jgi:hypothetical protein